MKKKPKNKAKLACELAQQLARLVETDCNGNGFCFSCGKPTGYWESHGGHFQPKGRDYNAACLDRRNVHLQCIRCNMYEQGNPAGYASHMVQKYGKEVIEELFLMSRHPNSKEVIEKYIIDTRKEIRELAKRKGFKVSVK